MCRTCLTGPLIEIKVSCDLLRTLAQRVATEGHVGVDFVDLDREGNRMDGVYARQSPVGGGEQGLAQRLALFLRAAAAQAGYDMHNRITSYNVCYTKLLRLRL